MRYSNLHGCFVAHARCDNLQRHAYYTYATKHHKMRSPPLLATTAAAFARARPIRWYLFSLCLIFRGGTCPNRQTLPPSYDRYVTRLGAMRHFLLMCMRIIAKHAAGYAKFPPRKSTDFGAFTYFCAARDSQPRRVISPQI